MPLAHQCRKLVCFLIASASAVAFVPRLNAQTGGAQNSADFSTIKPDSVPDHPEKGPFLFCYFLGNGDGLHLAASPNGLKFASVGGPNKTFLTPTIGVNVDGTAKDNHLMRDPCIRQGSDGMYHLVWTTGWSQHGFGVASSPDLVHWSQEQFVDVLKDEPTALNTWAPELFYDERTQNWLIFWATTIPGKFKETEFSASKDRLNNIVLNHRLYYVTTKNFKSFSESKLLYDPGFNCIDATMTKLPNGKYFMVFKDETAVPQAKKNLRTATADSAEGPWSKASDPISIDWVEGPTIARVGDAWYIYYDEYTRHKYGAIKTTDFQKWDLVNENFSFPSGSRHGTVFLVTQGVIDRLTKAAAE